MEKQGSKPFELSVDEINAVSGGESNQLTTPQEPPQPRSLFAAETSAPVPGPFPTN